MISFFFLTLVKIEGTRLVLTVGMSSELTGDCEAAEGRRRRDARYNVRWMLDVTQDGHARRSRAGQRLFPRRGPTLGHREPGKRIQNIWDFTLCSMEWGERKAPRVRGRFWSALALYLPRASRSAKLCVDISSRYSLLLILFT